MADPSAGSAAPAHSNGGGESEAAIPPSDSGCGRRAGARPVRVTRGCTGRSGTDRPHRRGRHRRRPAGRRGRDCRPRGSCRHLHGRAGRGPPAAAAGRHLRGERYPGGVQARSSGRRHGGAGAGGGVHAGWSRRSMSARSTKAERQPAGTAPESSYPRRQSTDTHVTVDELQEIPSARDPWVVLQTIEGVIVDRVNVGGIGVGTGSRTTGPRAPAAPRTPGRSTAS